ncbi:unnamed protein product [Spirodela intermedia]|uniref:RING-type domain-containing protein n=1 Tax=Spirodela intermedia TaxID=51605 RepID=A0A7I8K3G6_SPIIN|nr:unnamed protein product [Spirodela intermedia]
MAGHTSSGDPLEGERGRIGSVLSELVGNFVYGVLTCVFAIVGSFIGAITGAIMGLATESGFFCGAGIGAISGAVFSMDVVESCLVIWRSHGSGIWSILFVIDIIGSLFSGRLVREDVGPAVQSAVQSQMSARNTPFREATDIFETGGTKGMARASVERISKIRLTVENLADSSGEKLCCSVCLQDLQAGEIVRCLPHCGHMFHLPCIDDWLIRHGSCPLCRHDL